MTQEQQSKEKESVDTRTFPEIYKSLPQLQQLELRDEIVYKLGVSRVTVFNWAQGYSRPQYPGVRRIVSDILYKKEGVRIPQYILFDYKPRKKRIKKTA